jgi:hypothetical protein
VAASVAIITDDDVMVFAPVVGTREPNYPSLVSWTPSPAKCSQIIPKQAYRLSVPAQFSLTISDLASSVLGCSSSHTGFQ